MWYAFRPYVPVARRRAQAAREVEKRRKKGQAISPVVLEGRTIARTFWGKAWCDNLESYSDFANRLPRGRTYVRNGSVVDLQIHEGKVTALVSGSELYEVTIHITPLPDTQWHGIKSRCAGQIGSLVELLQGRLSKSVIEVVTARGRRPVPHAQRDQDVVLLSGLGRHVQARRRRAVRRRRPTGSATGAALPAAQGRSPGADRGGRAANRRRHGGRHKDARGERRGRRVWH